MTEAELRERIRTDRANGELLGPLVDRYGAGAVVDALGIPHVAGSLGILDGDDDASDGRNDD